MTYPEDISPEDLAGLPLVSYTGEVWQIENGQQLAAAVKQLKLANCLGFDTETKPNFKKGKSNQNHVALLQLADDQRVYLFRLNKIGLPEQIIDLLSNQSILKIGVAIHEDLSALRKLKNFEAGGFIDLQPYVKPFGITSMSLKKIAAIVLGVRISKTQQLSNWEGDVLTHQQVSYAATDAWLCSQIYNQLNFSKQL